MTKRGFSFYSTDTLVEEKQISHVREGNTAEAIILHELHGGVEALDEALADSECSALIGLAAGEVSLAASGNELDLIRRGPRSQGRR